MTTMVATKAILGHSQEIERTMRDADLKRPIIAYMDRQIGTATEQVYNISAAKPWNMMPTPQQWYRGNPAYPTCHSCGKVHRGKGHHIYFRRRGSESRNPTKTYWSCDRCHRDAMNDHAIEGRTVIKRRRAVAA